MASIVAENWDYAGSCDCSEDFELSPRNHNLLMSLLDETQVDDCDDESLNNVIRSLEAEIGYIENTYWESDLVDRESSIDESCGLISSITCNDLDLHWMDIDIASTSPSGDMGSNWYVDEHSGSLTDFGWVNNYSPLEADQDYGYVWHDANDTS